jgi:hypothetical protein
LAHVADFTPALREAILLARAAGLTESADRLDARVTAACATSSEWLGEVGEGIAEFLARERGHVPPAATELLEQCLREVAKVWPKYKRRKLWF